jgi:hypothetical protein
MLGTHWLQQHAGTVRPQRLKTGTDRILSNPHTHTRNIWPDATSAAEIRLFNNPTVDPSTAKLGIMQLDSTIELRTLLASCVITSNTEATKLFITSQQHRSKASEYKLILYRIHYGNAMNIQHSSTVYYMFAFIEHSKKTHQHYKVRSECMNGVLYRLKRPPQMLQKSTMKSPQLNPYSWLFGWDAWSQSYKMVWTTERSSDDVSEVRQARRA